MTASLDPSAALALPRRPLRAGRLSVGLLALTGGGLWLREQRRPAPLAERRIPTELAAAPEAPQEVHRVCTPGPATHSDRWAS